MARKKKRRPLRTFILFFFSIFLIWLFAFLTWLFWPGLEEIFVVKKEKIASEKAQTGSARERITERDRKKLEELLKKR